MFYILSKILLFLLSPFFWIIVLLGWSFYTKVEQRKKRLKILSVVLLIIFTNPFLFNVAVRSWQTERPVLPEGKTYDAVILLSGMSKTDRHEQSYFSEEADRFIQAIKLYRRGNAKYIAVTGGGVGLFKHSKPEADFLQQELMLQGVPADKILKENISKNTYENAVFIKQKLDSLHLKPPFLLVTSAIHMPRAKAVFENARVQVIAYPGPFKEVNHKKSFADYTVPDASLLKEWRIFLKEIVGMWVYKITGKA